MTAGPRFEAEHDLAAHYLGRNRRLPACSDEGGSVTTAFWDVTCERCLSSFQLAYDQYRYAAKTLVIALFAHILKRPSSRRS